MEEYQEDDLEELFFRLIEDHDSRSQMENEAEQDQDTSLESLGA